MFLSRVEEVNALVAEFTQEKRTGMIYEPLFGRRYFLQGTPVSRTRYFKSPVTKGLRRLRV